MSCTWYWETKQEIIDLENVRQEILKIDRGLVVESEENKPRPWKIKCSLLLRKNTKKEAGRQGPLNTPQTPTAAEKSRMFRVESPSWPTDEVLVIPSQRLVSKANTNPAVQAMGGQKLPHTVLQASKNIELLPFYSDFAPRKEIVVDGQSFIIGDFQVNVGVCRVSPLAYIILQARHLPCAISPKSSAYKSVSDAIGVGSRFPGTFIEIPFEQYNETFPETYGPTHQAVEAVELFGTLMSMQQS